MSGDARDDGGSSLPAAGRRAPGAGPSDEAILRRFLDQDGRLRQYPAKRAYQLVVLRWLASRFDPGRRYTQGEVDTALQDLHSFADWVFLRRELVDARLLDRTPDGRAYWRIAPRELADRPEPAGPAGR